MITYACGCKNEIHQPSGILHSVSKCADHRRQARDPATLGRDYYASIGLLTEDDQLAETDHMAQLIEALGPIPDSTLEEHDMIEVGCGVSPYARAFLHRGWRYTGIDPSPWAIKCMERICLLGPYYYWQLMQDHFESVDTRSKFGLNDLILCAHSLEHMADAPAALQKMADALAPGGQLWLIVPDDQDPVNPDHLWFWNVRSLVAEIKRVGLTVDLMTTRRYVEREQFIYCRASKL